MGQPPWALVSTPKGQPLWGAEILTVPWVGDLVTAFIVPAQSQLGLDAPEIPTGQSGNASISLPEGWPMGAGEAISLSFLLVPSRLSGVVSNAPRIPTR